MPKKIIPITDTKIKNARADQKKDYKLSDGDGLYLLISKAGGKHWKFEYRYDSKRKKVSLGSYPEISLSKARFLRAQYRAQVQEGQDPARIKSDTNTFKKVVDDFLFHRAGNLSDGTLKQIRTRMENHVSNQQKLIS